MKSGIELIAEERQDQMIKHNRTIEHDIVSNPNGELLKAALAIIDNDHNEWPANWEVTLYIKINDKEWIERLSIAGALIAAEIDRLSTQF